jgi:hypothetical protein
MAPAAEARGVAMQLMAESRHPDAEAVLSRLLDTEQNPKTRRLLGSLLGEGEPPCPRLVLFAGLVTEVGNGSTTCAGPAS